MELLKALDSSCDSHAPHTIRADTSVVRRGHNAQKTRQGRATERKDASGGRMSVWCFECLQTYLAGGFDSEHHSSPTCNCLRVTTASRPTKNPRSKKRAEGELDLLSTLEESDDSRDISGSTICELECSSRKEDKEILVGSTSPSTTFQPRVYTGAFLGRIEYCPGCKGPIVGSEILRHMTQCEQIR